MFIIMHNSGNAWYRILYKKRLDHYIRPERKLGFFVKIKEDENFNHSNTGSISRIEI